MSSVAISGALRTGTRHAVTTAAALALVVGVLALVQAPGGAMLLAGVLTMSLSRSRLLSSWRGRAEAAVALPVLGLATAGVGLLLVALPPVGAALVTAGLAASVWLRRLGPLWRRLGALIALPLIALLVTPGPVAGALGIGGVVLVSLLALAAAVLVRLAADALFGRAADPAEPVVAPTSALRPMPSTRMAVQLALAVGAAFVLGYTAFGEHWAWVVLTAYLVCAGNRGRADVALKAGLRVLGAAGGTVVAVLVTTHLQLEGPPLVVIVIALVAIGAAVRELSYAWWALVVTIVLSLLQSALGGPEPALVPRLIGIVVGAVLALAASWFVLPIRSIGVLRRRIADVLRVLADRAAGEPADVRSAMARLDEVAPAFLAVRWSRRWGEPARWIDALHLSVALLPDGPAPASVRRSIAGARAALRDRESLTAPLDRVCEAAAENL